MQPLTSATGSESLSQTHSRNYGGVKVALEIFSNWGHPSRIGLTEVQFVDWQGKKLNINHGEIESIGVADPIGELENLVNGKTKTVKECHMWSCALPQDGSSVRIVFTAESSLSSRLAGVKIWNYNKSVKELNIGVKRMRLTINDKLIFDGKLHKGCGSQVFDYSQLILINSSNFLASDEYLPSLSQQKLPEEEYDKFQYQSLPKNVNYSRNCGEDMSFSLPHAFERKAVISRKSIETNEIEDDQWWPSCLSSSTRISLVPEDEKGKTSGASSLGFMKSIRQLSPIHGTGDAKHEVISSSSIQNVESEGFDVKLQRERSVSSSALEHGEINRDVIIRPRSDNTDRKPQWFEAFQSRPSSEKSKPNSLDEKPLWLNDPEMTASEDYTKSQVSSRSSSAVSRIVDYDSLDVLDLPTYENREVELSLEESKQNRENSARFGRRALKAALSGRGSKQRDSSHTLRSRSGGDSHLEDSWSSLHAFEHNHKGRLDASVDAEGDILDLYMQEERMKRQNINKVPVGVSHAVQVLEPDGTELVDLETDFIIPELPEGQNLRVNILTTWGDKHYVGLNGIEIFSQTGEPAQIAQIWAEPSDINILPEYHNDPRVVSNLIDGVHRTHDDMHLWLAPFTPGCNHYIYLTFCQPTKIAMIRIWNYNKSRIHSFRGARHIEMILDEKPIFKGEIARACGAIQGSTDAFGDTILFTTDDDILESISHYDTTFSESVNSSRNTLEEVVDRPRTSDLGPKDERPFTSASSSASEGRSLSKSSLTSWEQSGSVIGQSITITLIATWGDNQYIGLTGIELLGEEEVISILPHTVTSTPSQQNKEALRLFDGVYITKDECHMWCVPITDRFSPSITIKFDQPTVLTALRMWNYNRNPEDAYTGVKTLSVTVDNNIISPPDGFTLRKAPGNCHFDYAQEISFAGPPSYYTSMPPAKLFRGCGDPIPMLQTFESAAMPCGFIFQLQLRSTWGDLYYVGLNGLEAYDAVGRKIPLTESNIAAYPDSVNVLDNIIDDVRTPDKLIDGMNITLDGRHMWLAPILPGVLNRIYLIFDYPVSVSLLKLWNYAKTPLRGVKEFGLLVDDLLVYNGILNQAKPCIKNMSHQTIIFTSDKDIISREKHSIIRYQDSENDVQLTNEASILHKGNSKNADQALRPPTSVTPGTSRQILRKQQQ